MEKVEAKDLKVGDIVTDMDLNITSPLLTCKPVYFQLEEIQDTKALFKHIEHPDGEEILPYAKLDNDLVPFASTTKFYVVK